MDWIGLDNNIKEKEDIRKSACDSDEDENIEDFFNQPTQLFSEGKELTNVHKDASKISDKVKVEVDDDIYNQPTQAYTACEDKSDDFFDGECRSC